MTADAETMIVGFDLGHGETALATVYAAKKAPPTVLKLPGSTRRQHVTAVAEHPQHGVLIGEHAASAKTTTSFYLAFKRKDFGDEGVRKPTLLFVRKLVEDVRQAGDVPRGNGTVHWVFGAPSGWTPKEREEYAKLFDEAGLKNVEVVPESRGALLYARDAGEVKVERTKLDAGVLIVDIGSSTTDYTSVMQLQASPVDHGNTRLGAGLIDLEIMRRVLEKHPDRASIEELMHDHPPDRRRVELICRRAKEQYFSTPADQLVADPDLRVGAIDSVPTRDREVLIDARLSKSDMDAVLATPLDVLGGRSWTAAFRHDLAQAVKRLGHKPGVVLLTGGPSRMPFVVEACREEMGPETEVLRGQEPEFAIARGLALAGRMSIKTRGFRQDVDALVKSKRIEKLVEERQPELATRLADAVSKGFTERHVIPAFRAWRNNEITTLDQVTTRVAKAVERDCDIKKNAKLKAIVAAWQNELVRDLEELTRPICAKWGLDRRAMRLPDVQTGTDKLKLEVGTGAVTETLDNLADGINLVVAGVVATTLFGGGVALVTASGGFLLPVVAFFGLWIALTDGKEKAIERAKAMNITPWVRKSMKSEASLVAKLRSDAGKQDEALSEEFVAAFTNGKAQLTAGVSKRIAKDLDALAREAEYFIS